MFATYTIPMLLSAAAVMASTHQARSHNNAAKLINDQVFTFGKRDQFVNKELTTWYPTDIGPDACTGKNHLDSDYVCPPPAPSSAKVLPSDSPKPASSAAKPSTPVVRPSSVVVKSSAAISTPAVVSTPAIETPVGNVATDPVADTESTSVPQAINGGLGEGTGGAASLGVSKLLGAVVVVAVAAVQALL